MLIEKVHGLQATTISLNDRFTLLAKTAPNRGGMRQQQHWRRNSIGSIAGQNTNNSNRFMYPARRMDMQPKRAIKQRLGVPQSGLRRFGSESNLPGLRRSNSFGNLSTNSAKSRSSWIQFNGNLRRSASFSNLTSAAWRGFRRRGGGQRQRGRNRGRGVVNGRVGRAPRGARAHSGRRARGGARGRGGVNRNQQQKPVVTKEELDLQLDQYMASTKSALDLELDNYMKTAMEME